jgi:RNA polymerase sigma-70 factor, ECF subfamily
MEESDQDLIRAIQAGNREAFETLYRRHRDWVVSLAYRFAGNREDALDVLQETFAYLLRKLPALELRSRFRTFLYPAVKHLALSRKDAVRRTVPLESAPERAESPAEVDEVGDLLRGLPDAQREVVLLRFADGLDLQEIAGALGIPLGTVKSRLHLALKALRGRWRPG